MSTEINK